MPPVGLRNSRWGLGRRSQNASWMISTRNMRSRMDTAISGSGSGVSRTRVPRA